MLTYRNLKTILLDAAHIYKSDMLKKKNDNPGYMIIPASGRNEISWDGLFSHSVFSYFFLMAAQQGDVNGDGVITALESYAYICAALNKYWNTDKQDADWNFLPKVTGGAEDIILFDQPTVVGDYIVNSQ